MRHRFALWLAALLAEFAFCSANNIGDLTVARYCKPVFAQCVHSVCSASLCRHNGALAASVLAQIFSSGYPDGKRSCEQFSLKRADYGENSAGKSIDVVCRIRIAKRRFYESSVWRLASLSATIRLRKQ